MHGNVWEWCQDENYPINKNELIEDCGYNEDKNNHLITGNRVLRGGSFLGHAASVGSAFRSGDYPSLGDNNIGFRPARTFR